MKFQIRAAVVAGALALSASPALAASDGVPGGKAYGKYCADQSRKHVEGEKGTPFSTCVKAMAKLSKSESLNPRKACAAESKKHVKGTKGTPFSLCVSGGRDLVEDLDS